MHYQIFRHRLATDSKFNLIRDLYVQVMSEDKALCQAAHNNIKRGVFVNGQMHPRLESAPLHVQQRVRECVKEQVAREKVAGREIWAARQAGNEDGISAEDEAICEGLRRGGGGGCATEGGVEW